MDLSNITINTQSSIRIAGEKILFFDPINIEDEQHDADLESFKKMYNLSEVTKEY